MLLQSLKQRMWQELIENEMFLVSKYPSWHVVIVYVNEENF